MERPDVASGPATAAESIQILDVVPFQGSHLTPLMRERIDPAYVEMHDRFIAGPPAFDERPARTSRATQGPPFYGRDRPPPEYRRLLDVQIQRKYTDRSAPTVPVRILWPASASDGSLPCFFHIHGGGWVLGDKQSEMHTCALFSQVAKCVVVSVEYRLAPDDPFPAAVEDCWEALQWVVEDARSPDGGLLGIDQKRIALGGASAGGNLAAAMSHMLLSAPHAPIDFKPALVLLTIPSLDMTAADPSSGSATWNDYPSWTEHKDGPALSASVASWFRNLYLPNPRYRLDWHASPLLAPRSHFSRLSKTHITTAGWDVYRDEGNSYAKLLKQHGVDVTYKCYETLPHPAIAFACGDGWARDLAQVLHDVFHL